MRTAIERVSRGQHLWRFFLTLSLFSSGCVIRTQYSDPTPVVVDKQSLVFLDLQTNDTHSLSDGIVVTTAEGNSLAFRAYRDVPSSERVSLSGAKEFRISACPLPSTGIGTLLGGLTGFLSVSAALRFQSEEDAVSPLNLIPLMWGTVGGSLLGFIAGGIRGIVVCSERHVGEFSP